MNSWKCTRRLARSGQWWKKRSISSDLPVPTCAVPCVHVGISLSTRWIGFGSSVERPAHLPMDVHAPEDGRPWRRRRWWW